MNEFIQKNPFNFGWEWWIGCGWLGVGYLGDLKIFFFANSNLAAHIISSMNISRGIIKSSKSIAGEQESRKVQLQINVSSHSIQLQDDVPSAMSDLEEISFQKTPHNKKQLLLKNSLSKDGKDSSKTIKARSCFKKEHSRGGEDDEEIKSTKSIKFKTKVENVFVYSLPEKSSKMEKDVIKKSIRRKEKVD